MVADPVLVKETWQTILTPCGRYLTEPRTPRPARLWATGIEQCSDFQQLVRIGKVVMISNELQTFHWVELPG